MKRYSYEVFESNGGHISLVIKEDGKLVSITTEYEYETEAGALTRLFYQLDHDGWDSYIYLDAADAVELINEDSETVVAIDDLYQELKDTNKLIAWGSAYDHDHIFFDEMGFAGRKVLGITEYRLWWIYLEIRNGKDWYEIDFDGEENYFESLKEAKQFIDNGGMYF